MNSHFAVILLGIAASAHSWPFGGVVSSIKEHLTQDFFQVKDQVEADAMLIEKHIQDNIKAVMSGDPLQAIKTLTKNYIELANLIAGHAMSNSFKMANDFEEDVEKIIDEYDSNNTSPGPENEASIKPETEKESVESKTDSSDEPETDASNKPETEASEEPEIESSEETENKTADETETKISGEMGTDTSNKPETETSDEPEVMISDKPEENTSDQPKTENSDEPSADGKDQQQSDVRFSGNMGFGTNMGFSF